MKFLTCTATNFGSYKELSFDFADAGLALIYGKTGSGKSTIQDIPCWALFGVTAKQGNADEVRSWQAQGEVTKVSIDVELPSGTITVVRQRGRPNQNDLYWQETGYDTCHRGKDITDTQKLLNARLGVDADLYLTAAYFSEFSSSGQFFNSKAKDRREVFERIANLDLAVRLGEKSSEARKEAKKDLAAAEKEHATVLGKLTASSSGLERASDDSYNWSVSQADAVNKLHDLHDRFEVTKAANVAELTAKWQEYEDKVVPEIANLEEEINNLAGQIQDPADLLGKEADIKNRLNLARYSTKCKTCGGPSNSVEYETVLDSQWAISKEVSKNAALIERVKNLRARLGAVSIADNPYDYKLTEAVISESTYLEQIEAELKRPNPFEASIARMIVEVKSLTDQKHGLLLLCRDFEARVSSLNHIYDLSFQLRGELLQRAVKEVETETNLILDRYFESEFRVGFKIEGSDTLDVDIAKNGHPCVYRQLSKGQRGLLRLAFGVAVMKSAANKAGVHFSSLFFDEAIDGLDADLKVKGFSLFEELASSHDSVFVIDHDQTFQSLFHKRYEVTLNGDESQVEVQDE